MWSHLPTENEDTKMLTSEVFRPSIFKQVKSLHGPGWVGQLVRVSS